MALLYTLLYVSEASDSLQLNSEIGDIVKTSVLWNKSVGITGVLIYSGGYFSQYLEGPEAAVTDIIEKIRCDRRHHSLNVASNALRSTRLFPSWSLAYAGDAVFVQNEMNRLFLAARRGAATKNAPMRMVNLMRDFIEMRARFGPTIH